VGRTIEFIISFTTKRMSASSFEHEQACQPFELGCPRSLTRPRPAVPPPPAWCH
jgi:hypothetical protein